MANEPLRKQITIACSIEHAFDVFAHGIDAWWPRNHRGSPGSTLRLETRNGGRFYEETPDGQEAELGEVLAWEPPNRLAYSWWPGALERPTHVEVRFSEEVGTTRVEIVHSDGAAGAAPGWLRRVQGFDAAWSDLLPRYQAACMS